MMSYSQAEEYSEMVKNGYLTINEVRAMEGLKPLTLADIPSHCHTLNFGSGLVALNKPSKIVCAYCARPNSNERELCASCGAPLAT